METVRRDLSEVGSEVLEDVVQRLPDRDADRYGETVSSADKAGEATWLQGIDDRFDDYAFVSEEGAVVIEGDPEYIFLVDPLDGSSLATNGESPYVTSSVAVLEPTEVSRDELVGEPLGSYAIQASDETEYFAWLGEEDTAEIDGSVRWTDVSFEDELPGHVDDERGETYIGPRDVNSLDDLENTTSGMVSNYSAKGSRLDVVEAVNEPLMRDYNTKIETWGGTFGGLSVGIGRNILAFEARPTKPTEAAGDIFASAMGAHWQSMTGDEISTIEIDVGEDGPRKTYSSQVSATEELAEEVRDVIDLESLYRNYPKLEQIQQPVAGINPERPGKIGSDD